jgi:serine O-acetyltransferase
MNTLRRDLIAAATDRGKRPVPSRRALAAAALGTAKGLAVALFRASQWLGPRAPGLAAAVKLVNHALTGADLAWQAQAGPGLVLYHPAGVVIGPDVTLGAGCALGARVTLGHGGAGSPTLGDGVYVAPGAVVIGRVSIEAGAQIGANAVVLDDVPAGAFAAGVPATIRRGRDAGS